MTLVKFACICDAAGCARQSEQYSVWPSCRGCKLDTCPDHTAPGSLQQKEHDRETEDGTEAVMTESVYCLDCLATWGAE